MCVNSPLNLKQFNLDVGQPYFIYGDWGVVVGGGWPPGFCGVEGGGCFRGGVVGWGKLGGLHRLILMFVLVYHDAHGFGIRLEDVVKVSDALCTRDTLHWLPPDDPVEAMHPFAIPPPRPRMITIISWNVNGLLDRIRHLAVLKYVKRNSPDVAMLQETHLLGTRCTFLGCLRYDRVYHLGFTRDSRGVAILVHRSFPFSMMRSKIDTLGRYFATWRLMEGRTFNFMNIYVPPHLHGVRIRDLSGAWLTSPLG